MLCGDLERWCGASLLAQTVKNPPDNARDPGSIPEKGMATHSSFLPGKALGQRSLGGYSPWDCKELDTTEQLTHTHRGGSGVGVGGRPKRKGTYVYIPLIHFTVKERQCQRMLKVPHNCSHLTC